MEKTFWQRLQMVKITDIIHIFKFLIAFPISIIAKIFIKDLWVVCDCENEARDNGFYFFKYLREKQVQQNVVYAINKKSPDYLKVKKLGKTVHYGSLKHWILYLTASKNISSQKGGKPNSAICYILEVYGIIKNKRIFLQHGVIKDNLPYLHYKNAKLSMFSVTTKREYDYVVKEFGYPEGVIQQVGLCRYDTLEDKSTGDIILIMPTWRQWIAHKTTNSKLVENVQSFKETNYYKTWLEVLKSTELEKTCKENNKKVIFYPHRNMQKFIDDFKNTNKDFIEIATWKEKDVQELINKSSLMITDYSSVAMDFAFLNKPVIYYQFDYEQFRKGHLEEGYFNYEKDGFGVITKAFNTLISSIENKIKEKFKLKEKYQERINNFFDIRDKKNCERTYYKIKEI